MTINYNPSGVLNLPAGLIITGNLTVNAPNATVNNYATVNGTITINAVSGNTWNEYANNNSLHFKATQKTLNIGNNVTVKNLKLEAPDAKVTIADTATFTTPVEIKAAATIIAKEPVTTKIESGVEVTLKAIASDAGVKVTGTGGAAAPVDPSEVNRVMGLLEHGMLDNIPYPGDQGEPGNMTYTLATFVGEKVKALTTDPNIKLVVSNMDSEYGYYKVTLTIAGATVSTDIRVDTLTVETAKAFKDALGYNINKINLADNIETEKQIIVGKKDLTIDGKGYTLSAASEMAYSEPNKSVLTVSTTKNVKINNLTVDATKVNTLNKWNGVYAIQVYNSKGIELDGVTLKNGDAGLLVNGSIVTVNNITTLGNEFGGIEVSQGSGVTLPATLTVTGTSKHDISEDVYIWTIGNDATVMDSGDQYKSGEDTRDDKVGYVNYILASETRPVPHTAIEDTTKPSATLTGFGTNTLILSFDEAVKMNGVTLSEEIVVNKLEFINKLFVPNARYKIDNTTMNESEIEIKTTANSITLTLNNNTLRPAVFKALDTGIAGDTELDENGLVGNNDGKYRMDAEIDLSKFIDLSGNSATGTISNPFKIQYNVTLNEDGTPNYDSDVVATFLTK